MPEAKTPAITKSRVLPARGIVMRSSGPSSCPPESRKPITGSPLRSDQPPTQQGSQRPRLEQRRSRRSVLQHVPGRNGVEIDSDREERVQRAEEGRVHAERGLDDGSQGGGGRFGSHGWILASLRLDADPVE